MNATDRRALCRTSVVLLDSEEELKAVELGCTPEVARKIEELVSDSRILYLDRWTVRVNRAGIRTLVEWSGGIRGTDPEADMAHAIYHALSWVLNLFEE